MKTVRWLLFALMILLVIGCTMPTIEVNGGTIPPANERQKVLFAGDEDYINWGTGSVEIPNEHELVYVFASDVSYGVETSRTIVFATVINDHLLVYSVDKMGIGIFDVHTFSQQDLFLVAPKDSVAFKTREYDAILIKERGVTLANYDENLLKAYVIRDNGTICGSMPESAVGDVICDPIADDEPIQLRWENVGVVATNSMYAMTVPGQEPVGLDYDVTMWDAHPVSDTLVIVAQLSPQLPPIYQIRSLVMRETGDQVLVGSAVANYGEIQSLYWLADNMLLVELPEMLHLYTFETSANQQGLFPRLCGEYPAMSLMTAIETKIGC